MIEYIRFGIIKSLVYFIMNTVSSIDESLVSHSIVNEPQLPYELQDKTIRRAGVIPYMKNEKTVLFIFGLDEGIASISDFGGTREDFDKDVYGIALREFQEETFGIMGTIKRGNLIKAPYIVGETGYHETEKGVLFFVQYSNDFPFTKKMQEFKERNMPGDETRGLIVLSKEQLISGLKQPEERIQSSKVFLFHPKVRSILLSGNDIISSL